MYHVQLIIQPLLKRPVILRIPPGHAFLAQLVQIPPGIVAVRHVKPWQLCHPKLNLHIAPVRNLVGIVQSLLGIGKQRPHLLLGLTVKLSPLIPHPVLVSHLFPCLDAQKDVVSRRVLSQSIVDVIGGHQVYVQILRKAQKGLIHRLLSRNPVVLQLQKKVPLSEDPLIP